jgi:SAM-dependent methyltransferase
VTDDWQVPAATWQKIYRPPLLPDEPELALIRRWLQQVSTQTRTLDALLLGVTPEYCTLPWPQQGSLLALDHSQSMIDKLWRGSPEQVLCADWLDMPLPAGSRNFALCDGGLCLQAYPHAQLGMVQALARVMAPRGVAIIRCFVLPQKTESLARVLDELGAGNINNLSELQLRLWVVLQQSRTEGVTSRQFWDSVTAAIPDRMHLARMLGTDAPVLQKASAAAGARRYYFTDLREIITWFSVDPGGFALEEILVPHHALGEHCPSLVLRRL